MHPPKQGGDNDGVKHPKQNAQSVLLVPRTPDLLPQEAITVAAWVNVTSNDRTDQSVFQGRASGDSGHACPHFQLQTDGKLRLTIRNGATGNIVDSRVYIDGTTDSGNRYPVNEWFHYSGTYDMNTNVWTQYYNGVPIASGSGTGEMMGDWGGHESAGDYFAAGFGAVYDSGARRLDGLMDELYVFHRSVAAEEIQILYNLGPPCAGTADFNCDGDVDHDDLLTWMASFGIDVGGDTDDDSDTDGTDFLNWQIQFGAGSGVVGSVVPEPNTFSLLALAGLAFTRIWPRLLRQYRREIHL